MTIPSCNMCYLSESFWLFARSLAFMLLVIKENGVNDIKDLPPVGQSLLTRTSSLWFPDPGSLSQCLPPLTEHTKYLTVSSLPILIVCGPSSISFSLLIAFICVCHKYYNIIITRKKAACWPLFPRPCRQLVGLRPTCFLFFPSFTKVLSSVTKVFPLVTKVFPLITKVLPLVTNN